MRPVMLFGTFLLMTLATSSKAAGVDARRITWANRYPVIGDLDKPKTLTGGWMPTAQFSYGLPVGEGELRVGGELGAFGFGAPSNWLGILGGAFADIGGRPVARIPVAAVLTGRLSAGRVPVINSWGFPLKYSGVYPGAALAVS